MDKKLLLVMFLKARELADELTPAAHITQAVYFCTKPHISTWLEHSFQRHIQAWLGFM